MKKLFIIVVVCILILLAGGFVWYIINNSKTNIVVPLGKLKLTDNSIISIPEFIINNEATTKLPSDVFRNIAGDEKSNYHISYLPYNKENSQIQFNITLNTLPLSEVRLEAENVLRAKLGVTNQELCKMDISVYVFGWVDKNYAGQNLGLSFCDNAIPLP